MEPLGPVAAQLEEVLEVHKACLFQPHDEIAQALLTHERSNGHERAFDTEFIGRQIQGKVEPGAGEVGPFESALPNEERRGGV